MIKRKGVCDVCTTQFDLDEGSFAVRIMEDEIDCSHKKWTITVLDCTEDTPEKGFSHVCGIGCLYETITKVIDKTREECKSGIVDHDGTDDSNVRVLDLTDKSVK
jgi:hypothetical protein